MKAFTNDEKKFIKMVLNNFKQEKEELYKTLNNNILNIRGNKILEYINQDVKLIDNILIKL